jgi:pyruvate dehydrogenase E1 component
MPEMPVGVEEGIIKGIYRLSTVDAGGQHHVNLFGSGAILNSVLAAQRLLAERYGVSSHVWSVTSYTQLHREARSCERWNMLHPGEEPRVSYLERALEGQQGVFVSASDYVRALGDQLRPWIPGDYHVLGCDGMGRSETRSTLRRHFEVDAQCITVAALYRLHRRGELDAKTVAGAIRDLEIDPAKRDPLTA